MSVPGLSGTISCACHSGQCHTSDDMPLEEKEDNDDRDDGDKGPGIAS
jgi:hypothetical protein